MQLPASLGGAARRVLPRILRLHVISGFEEYRVDFRQRNKLRDLHVRRGSRCDRPQLLRSDGYVPSTFELVTFLEWSRLIGGLPHGNPSRWLESRLGSR